MRSETIVYDKVPASSEVLIHLIPKFGSPTIHDSVVSEVKFEQVVALEVHTSTRSSHID